MNDFCWYFSRMAYLKSLQDLIGFYRRFYQTISNRIFLSCNVTSFHLTLAENIVFLIRNLICSKKLILSSLYFLPGKTDPANIVCYHKVSYQKTLQNFRLVFIKILEKEDSEMEKCLHFEQPILLSECKQHLLQKKINEATNFNNIPIHLSKSLLHCIACIAVCVLN